MSKTIADRALALAGIYQATTLVHRFANNKSIDERQIETAIKSILAIDAQSTAEVFGGVANLRLGLTVIRDNLTGKVDKDDIAATRYALALMHLQRKLIKRRDMLAALTDGIKQAQNQVEYFSLRHENVIASLGDLYQRTISNLGTRIMVQGNPEVLAVPHNQNMIRTLLLAGMRSAVLWDQSGGGRLQLVFNRRALSEAAASLLGTLNEHS